MVRWTLWVWMLVLLPWCFGGCSGVSEHVRRGDELAKAGNHEEALSEFERAARLRPEDAEVSARISQTKKTMATNVATEGIIALEKKDYTTAAISFKKARDYNPEDVSHRDNLKKAMEGMVVLGKNALAEKKYSVAASIFAQGLQLVPNYPPVRDGAKEVDQAWAVELLQTSTGFEKRRLYGNALLSLVKLRKLVGTLSDSSDRETAAREKLRALAAFEVVLTASKFRKPEEAASQDLLRMIEELKIPRCPAITTSSTASTSGSRLNIQIAVEGLGYNQDKENSEGTQKYQSGTKKVDNPKYLETEQKIESDKSQIEQLGQALENDAKALEELRQRFADSGPDDDDGSLRAQLKGQEKTQVQHREDLFKTQKDLVTMQELIKKTPRLLDEPVYSEHVYEIHKVIRTATMVVKILGQSNNVVLLKDMVSGKASTSDTTNKALPKYGVKADPLVFPVSDGELKQQALGDAAAKIGEAMGGACQGWRDNILARARQAADSSPIEATEDYILFLFLSPDKPQAEAIEYLKKKHEFDDLQMLFGK